MVMVLKDKFINKWKNRKFYYSLKYALEGLISVFIEERNFRFEFVCFGCVVLLGFITKLNCYQWLWILLASVNVFISEMINTSIENLTDLASNLSINDLAKKAKDVAAGAVLISSIFAFIVALIIFIPKLEWWR